MKMQQLEKITALLDEITDLRARLQANQGNAAMEIALLENLSIELYRQIQQSKNAPEQQQATPSSPRRLTPISTPATTVKSADIDRKKEKLMRDEETETPKQNVTAQVKEAPKQTEKQPEPAKENITNIYAQAREKATAASVQAQQKPADQQVKSPEPQQKAEAPQPAPEPVKQKESPQSLHEKLQGQSQSSSINEKFAQQQVKRNLADKLKLSPINDLRTAININQKVAFTKILFMGDDKEFKRVLTFINESRNFSEAKFYLQTEIGSEHNWKDDDPVVQEFMELVYRKFL